MRAVLMPNGLALSVRSSPQKFALASAAYLSHQTLSIAHSASAQGVSRNVVFVQMAALCGEEFRHSRTRSQSSAVRLGPLAMQTATRQPQALGSLIPQSGKVRAPPTGEPGARMRGMHHHQPFSHDRHPGMYERTGLIITSDIITSKKEGAGRPAPSSQLAVSEPVTKASGR